MPGQVRMLLQSKLDVTAESLEPTLVAIKILPTPTLNLVDIPTGDLGHTELTLHHELLPTPTISNLLQSSMGMLP